MLNFNKIRDFPFNYKHLQICDTNNIIYFKDEIFLKVSEYECNNKKYTLIIKFDNNNKKYFDLFKDKYNHDYENNDNYLLFVNNFENIINNIYNVNKKNNIEISEESQFLIKTDLINYYNMYEKDIINVLVTKKYNELFFDKFVSGIYKMFDVKIYEKIEKKINNFDILNSIFYYFDNKKKIDSLKKMN